MSLQRPLVTIFTVPKPFRGAAVKAQERAIQSWVNLGPECQVILVGDEYGISEIAERYGVRHLPFIERNEFGTPLVNATFRAAEVASDSPLLCYINGDIILTSNFLQAIRSVPLLKFLLVGRRWNIDPAHVPDPSVADWEEQLLEQVKSHGRLFTAAAIDYFVYTRGLWPTLPPLTIGRAAWDNYMIYSVRVRHLPVIDATSTITAIHQNHDYSHHSGGHMGVWTGEEATRNRELAGGYRHLFFLTEATWVLTRHGLRRPPMTGARLLRTFDTLPVFHPLLAVPCSCVKLSYLAVRKIVRALAVSM